MKNKEIESTLQNIKELIEIEEYNKAIEYIDRKLIEISTDKDLSSEYIDDLVKELK